jgi:hypothetical protein
MLRCGVSRSCGRQGNPRSASPIGPRSLFKIRWCVEQRDAHCGLGTQNASIATADSWRGIQPSWRPGSFRIPAVPTHSDRLYATALPVYDRGLADFFRIPPDGVTTTHRRNCKLCLGTFVATSG